ncbi:hypothetical protein Tco_0595263 [Tanacetum coccineum]
MLVNLFPCKNKTTVFFRTAPFSWACLRSIFVLEVVCNLEVFSVDELPESLKVCQKGHDHEDSGFVDFGGRTWMIVLDTAELSSDTSAKGSVFEPSQKSSSHSKCHWRQYSDLMSRKVVKDSSTYWTLLNCTLSSSSTKTLHASANKPAQSDPLGHLHEERCLLKNKLPGLLKDALKDTLPQLIKDSIKNSILESIAEELPQVEAQNQTAAHPNHSRGSKTQGVNHSLQLCSGGASQLKYTKWQKQAPLEPTPPIDEHKGKGIATEDPIKDIMPFLEEGGSAPKIPSFKSFVILERQLSQEDIMAQVKEMKRLADLKAEKEKFEKSLKEILNPATIRAQTQDG